MQRMMTSDGPGEAPLGEGLELVGATKAYGSRTLWQGLSFRVPRGTMTALTGPSGSGKSTLLNCLGTLETFDAGTVHLDGREVNLGSAGGRRRFRRDSLGYLFQNYALVDTATINQNLDIGRGAIRVFGRGRPRSYNESLEAVGLGGRGNDVVFRLSGGEQQRVALARILVKRPSVVLADEPTGALDENNERMVVRHLRELARSGCSVVVATHQPSVAEACDDRIDLTPA